MSISDPRNGQSAASTSAPAPQYDPEILAELITCLEDISGTFKSGKLRKGGGLASRFYGQLFVSVATRRLGQLIRRARRMARQPSDQKAFVELLKDIFGERRVLRSKVSLRRAYPRIADVVHAAGRHLQDDAGRETRSLGAVMQLCAVEADDVAEIYERPEIRRALTDRHRQMLGVEPLDARNLLETGEAGFTPSPGHVAYIAAMTLPYKTNGYSSRTEGVALAYQSIGLTIDVISKVGFPLDVLRGKSASDIPEVETVNGVHYHRIPEPRFRGGSYRAYAARAADAIAAKLTSLRPAHVIAASNFETSLPALIAARRLGLPFTYEVRGMWELTRASEDPGFVNTPQFMTMRALETFVCRHSDRVLTLTEPMRDNLVDRGVAPEKITLMRNGVSPEMLETAPRDPALAEMLGLPPSHVIIGYAGAFMQYEGLQDLAAAVAQLAAKGRDVTLLIVGAEGPDAFGRTPITSEIREAFEAVGMSDRLVMTGRVPFKEIKRYYALMDICPIPRRGLEVSEMVSPIKPVEALAQGKAVVLSDVAAMQFFAQGGKTARVFRKGDVAHLAEVIEDLALDPESRRLLSDRGRAFVASELQWSKICSDAAAHIGLA